MNKVINFHEVHDPKWFESVILLLRKKYKMLSGKDVYDYYYNKGESISASRCLLHIGNEAINSIEDRKNTCLITVDDGHKTSYSVIYPILKKYNIPAIFFVSPEIAENTNSSIFWFHALKQVKNDKLVSEIKDSNESIDEIWNKINHYINIQNITLEYDQYMTMEQIRQIDEENLVAIGAHTMTHPFLARESDEHSQKEITDSITRLSDLLGHPIHYFAYPNGRPVLDFGEREINILKTTTVRLSFSTEPDNFSLKNNPYAIPRFGLSTGSIRFIKMKLLFGKYYPIIRSLIKREKINCINAI